MIHRPTLKIEARDHRCLAIRAGIPFNVEIFSARNGLYVVNSLAGRSSAPHDQRQCREGGKWGIDQIVNTFDPDEHCAMVPVALDAFHHHRSQYSPSIKAERAQ